MDIYNAYRFYSSSELLTKNKENREDAAHIPPFYEENNYIPSFQVSLPFYPGDLSIEFVIIDKNGNETDLTSDVTLFEEIRIVEGVPMRYIIHNREKIFYDAGCYYSEIRIASGQTFYGSLFENLVSTYVETWNRLVNGSNEKRIVNATDKRKTQ